MEFVGEFLNLTCGSKSLKAFLCKERSTYLSRHTSVESFPIDSYQLHYAPGYSQSQIICLITELFEGVPECFEVFHCKSSTTKEELYLFMERIEQHPLHYLVLEVNKLSFSLQEVYVYASMY